MYYGVDIGSTYIKIVGLDKNNNIIDLKVLNTSINPDEMVKDYLKNKVIKTLVATGYGRYMMQEAFKVPVISEIKAHAKGAYYFFNDVRTIIDLGGQDSKIIKVIEGGNFDNFKMNDKCAAGTGKFIEIAASRLQIPLEKFGEIAKTRIKRYKFHLCAPYLRNQKLFRLLRVRKNLKILLMGL